MKTIRLTGIFLILLAVLAGCHRGLLPPDYHGRSARTIQWGGGPTRSGEAEVLQPPLRMVWRERLNAGVGRAIPAMEAYVFFGVKDGHIQILHARTAKSVRKVKVRNKTDVTCLPAGDRLALVARWGRPSLRAVDAISGKSLWTCDAGPVEGEPLLFEDCITVGTDRGEVLSVSLETGEILWRKKLKHPMRASLAAGDDALFAVSSDGIAHCLHSSDGTLLWQTELSGSVTTSPVLSQGNVYIGTREGTFFALGQQTGDVVWKVDAGGAVYETAAASDGQVYFGTSQGDLVRLNASTGREIWRFSSSSVVGTSPVISGDWIYFGTLDGILYAVDRMSGEAVWQTELKGRIRTDPLIWQGMLIIASEDRYVYGFVQDK